MSWLDIEGVLADAIEREYGLADPFNEGYKPESRTLARILAAVLREQIAVAIEQARELGKFDAMEKVLDPKGPIWNRMHAEGWDEGHRFTGYEPQPGENPYWSALAAQVAPSRVPGEGSCHCDRTESALVQCPLHRVPGEGT